MAGEYYRWLARNEKPEEVRELTKEEKRRNWWAYHKWHVVITIICLIFAADLISDMIRNSRNVPDYKIAYVGTTALPDDTIDALEASFARLGEDLNGNGKVQVELISYQLLDENAPVTPGMEESSAERGYNASMLLMLNVETVESMIYLLEDPALFTANYPILTRVDGSDPKDGSGSELPLYYRWSQCPVLTELELGTFEIPVVGGVATGDSQKAMENICIARRGLWNDAGNETTEGALRLWDILTEGAAK